MNKICKSIVTTVWILTISLFLFSVNEAKAAPRLAACAEGSELIQIVHKLKTIGVPKERVWEEFKGLGGQASYKKAVEHAVNIVYPYDLPFDTINQIFLEQCLDYSTDKKGREM